MQRHLVLATSMLCLVSCARPSDEAPAAQRATPRDARPARAEPKAGPPAGSLSTISVTITAQKLFVRGKAVEPEHLPTRLEALAERSPAATVAVQADATVPKERMTALLATIKAAGFTTVEVATRPVH